MTLPTPEELWRGVDYQKDRMVHVSNAIRADREAIAKVVQEMVGTTCHTFEHHSCGCCTLMDLLALLRPTKKGEPPLDDSPTAPLA